MCIILFLFRTLPMSRRYYAVYPGNPNFNRLSNFTHNTYMYNLEFSPLCVDLFHAVVCS
jgi:hypothetical protein